MMLIILCLNVIILSINNEEYKSVLVVSDSISEVVPQTQVIKGVKNEGNLHQHHVYTLTI